VNLSRRFGNDSSMEARSDAELLARAATEPELFGVVFDRHFATIHRYLERRIGRDGADELSGEVFRIAFEQRKRFRPVHESALPWLYGLATNLLLKRWRGERREARAIERLAAASRNGGGPEAHDERIAATVARSRLLEALAQLPVGDRDVLVLIAWEDLTYEEVAIALAIPVGTVRSRLNRARTKLRELLPEIGNEPVKAMEQDAQ
jgi:RNA polymerase sigma factor (sigma-70 family)